MTTLVEDDQPLEEFLFDLHISIGVTLLALLVARIAIRMMHRPPSLPDAIRGVERTAAHLGHVAFYALPALVVDDHREIREPPARYLKRHGLRATVAEKPASRNPRYSSGLGTR